MSKNGLNPRWSMYKSDLLAQVPDHITEAIKRKGGCYFMQLVTAYFFDNPGNTRKDLYRDLPDLDKSTGPARITDGQKMGVLYISGRKNGAGCVYVQTDLSKWAYHATSYRNERRNKRVKGLLNEYGTEMPDTLKKQLKDWGAQTRLV